MKKVGIISVLALILTIAFVCSLPVSAVENSGTCGENMTWVFDEATGTLTITGQGEMDAGEYPVWQHLRNHTTNIVIGEGVTSISYSAFSHFQNLISASLPSSLRTIESKAFAHCYKLGNVTLTNVTYIGKYAFLQCSSMTDVTIPAGVTQINYGTFSDCRGLKNVTFHNALTEIDSYAFSSCQSLTYLTIPDSVKTIGGNAFGFCDNLSGIQLSSGLTYLGGNVFMDCSRLEKITIPDGVSKISVYTFSGCSSLKEVVIGSGVSTIDTTAFKDCSSLQSFTLSSENASFSVDKGVLYNKSKTELMLMPAGFIGGYTVLPGTIKISDYSCYGVAGLTSVTVPGSVRTIGDYAFDDCRGLNSIKLSNGLETISHSAFAWTGISEITIPATVTKIDNQVFSWCTNMKKIIFTGNAPEIAEAAFSNITVDAYYPGDKPGWRGATRSYGGTIEWISTACINHQPVTDPAKEPNCIESGLSEGSHCGVCGTVIVEQQITPAKGHSVVKWTKVDDKSHEGVCTVCAQHETNSHEWNDGVVIKQPTCTAAGEKAYTCTGCSATKTMPIEKTAHNFGKWNKIDDATHKHACLVCGKEETKNHAWDNGEESPKATCVAEGVKTYTCTDCGIKKTESVPKLTTHTFDNSCDPNCNFCDVVRTVTHSYSESYNSSKEGHWYQCKVCGQKTDVVAHIPGPAATAEQSQSCTACGYILQPSLDHTHSYSDAWTADKQAHWHACDGCGEYSGYGDHNFSNDCDDGCDTCSYSRETSHKYGTEWECDGVSHWHSCTVCGAREDAQNHVPGAEATDTTGQYCQVCEYELAPAVTIQTEPKEEATDPEQNENEFTKVVLWSAIGLAGACAAVLAWTQKKKVY